MSYRFAIVGCGHIGRRHAELVGRHGHLLAVCDNDSERALELSAKHHAKAYFSMEELLQNERPDIVSICTPNGLHAAHAIAALQRDCHVLCEKPMSISSLDCQQMIAAAQKSGKKLFVVKQNRYNAPVAMVKQLLSNNNLGRISSFELNCFWNRPIHYYRDSWRGTNKLDGGTLYTQFSHFIDLLYWFLGDLKSVKGIRKNREHGNAIEFEDCGAALLEMQNGSIGTINYSINSFKQNMEGSFTLFGEKGTVKIGGQYLNKLEYFSVEGMSEPPMPKQAGANDYGFYQGSMSNHDKVYENLVLALHQPEHDMVEAAEAAKTVEMIEQVYAHSPLST